MLPRFRHLSDGEVKVKAPGDVVTIADHEAERALTAGLSRLLPGSEVVGEEAVAADPDVLGRLGDRGAVWVVDPVDGTNNFAAGKTPHLTLTAVRALLNEQPRGRVLVSRASPEARRHMPAASASLRATADLCPT